MRASIACLLLLAACASSGGAVDLPENYREQLHAVTGHDPAACTDLRNREATIEITDQGFSPECAIVDADQDITLINRQAIADTWIVADPPTELEIARHTRLVFEIDAGTTAVVDRIGERVSTGVWVCYGRESHHECQLVVVR